MISKDGKAPVPPMVPREITLETPLEVLSLRAAAWRMTKYPEDILREMREWGRGTERHPLPPRESIVKAGNDLLAALETVTYDFAALYSM